MIILNDFNEIKNIVESRAKYQKVMLIYDEETSETEIIGVYEQIKEICMFNKMIINQDLEEIYNGYKLLIFCVSSNSFLQFNYNIEEFVSVFIINEQNALPFYLDYASKKSLSERYLFSSKKILDIGAISSVKFNRFYNYLNELISYNYSQLKLDFESNNYVDINTIENDFCFYDIEILKKACLSYDKVLIVDFLILCGFNCVINAISNNTLQLVDCYKSIKEDIQLIDKFYALQASNTFVKIIELNINFLSAYCNKTKTEILNLLKDVNETEIVEILSKIKDYSKNENSLLNYLYLYNVFGY